MFDNYKVCKILYTISSPLCIWMYFYHQGTWNLPVTTAVTMGLLWNYRRHIIQEYEWTWKKKLSWANFYLNFVSEFERLSLDSRVEKNINPVVFTLPTEPLTIRQYFYMSNHFQEGFPVVFFFQIWLQLMTDSCMEAVQTCPLLIECLFI